MGKSIVITGATGFIGRALCLELFRQGHDLRIVTRDPRRAAILLPLPVSFYEWDGQSEFPYQVLEGAKALIHLAGEPLAQRRWSSAVKEKLASSRSISTRLIMEAIKRCKTPPEVVIGASAIGIYGDREEEELSEESGPGQGFLAQVCKDWEAGYCVPGPRLVIFRIGVVLGYGGALEKMQTPFRLWIGAPLGKGSQWMSWIHIEDLIASICHALRDEKMAGVFNAVAPEPSRNRDFSRELAKLMKVPLWPSVPSAMIKLAFGEMSQVLLSSQRVSSKKLEAQGFKFKYRSASEALSSIFLPEGKRGVHVLEAFQWVRKPRAEIFPFFSEARNLERITPPWLNFMVLRHSDESIREGTLIDYRLRLKGIPLRWRTLIRTWNPPEQFSDEQLKGPYEVWHHTHGFEEAGGGTLLTDRVLYKVPMGPLGELIRLLMVKKDVEQIFNFRTREIKKLFGP